MHFILWYALILLNIFAVLRKYKVENMCDLNICKVLYCNNEWYNLLCQNSFHFSSVQLLCCVQLFVTSWTATRQASLSFTISQSLLKLMSIKSVMPSNHLVLPSILPSIFPSIRVFFNELALHIKWPKYCSFSFNFHPSNEYTGLTSFRIDWLELLAVQGTLKSLL